MKEVSESPTCTLGVQLQGSHLEHFLKGGLGVLG